MLEKIFLYVLISYVLIMIMSIILHRSHKYGRFVTGILIGVGGISLLFAEVFFFEKHKDVDIPLFVALAFPIAVASMVFLSRSQYASLSNPSRNRYCAYAFGALLGISFVCVKALLPQPMGTSMYLLILSLWLAIGVVTTWTRTRLPFLSIGMFSGTLIWLLGAFLKWQGGSILSHEWFIPMVALGFTIVFMRYVESRVNPEKWKAIEVAILEASFTDMFFFRWIPKLH